MHDESNDRPVRTFLLIDDDKFSARFFSRQLTAQAADLVNIDIQWIPLASQGMEKLHELAEGSDQNSLPDLIIVDLKANSSANQDFVLQAAPLIKKMNRPLVVFATLDSPDLYERLIQSGADAVFERHADLARYGTELKNILSFSARETRAA